jgi:hypothetical protein
LDSIHSGCIHPIDNVLSFFFDLFNAHVSPPFLDVIADQLSVGCPLFATVLFFIEVSF